MTDQPGRVGTEPPGAKSDPTALTTDQLQREIAQINKLLDEKIAAINLSIQDQRELRNAQLANIQQQLTHAEALRRELKEDNEKNIDRALTGVEKATEKLETSITRTLAQVIESNKSDIAGLRRDIDALKDRINDNKERVAGVEQRGAGAKEVVHERQSSSASTWGIVGGVAGLLFLLMGIATFVMGLAQRTP